MMIHGTKTVTREMLKKNQEIWFYEATGQPVVLCSRFNNPFFRGDSRPNCSYVITRDGIILLKDFKRNMLWNAWEAKTASTNRFSVPTNGLPKVSMKKANPLSCRYRLNPTQQYYDYFMKAGVDIKLEKSVKQVSRIFFGDSGFYPNDLTISYLFPSGKQKVYRPFNKKQKFLSNTSKNDVWNWKPDQEKYYLTSSMKDALVLEHNTGVTSIASQSETTIPTDLLDSLRGKNVFVVFDSDDVGIKKMRELNREYGFKSIILSEKDPYDLAIKRSVQQLKDELKHGELNSNSQSRSWSKSAAAKFPEVPF